MLSLQKLLGRDDKFFDLLQASAEEGLRSLEALKHVLASPSSTPDLEQFVASRRKDKLITQEIREMLVKTFVTALDRADIEQLSNALYQIPKTLEKFAERYVLCAPRLQGVKFDTQVAMLEEAIQIVVTMLKELKKNDLSSIAAQNSRLQQIEGDADKLMLDRFRVLYGGPTDPITALGLKDLYEIMEKAFDRCRDAGNVISHVVLKHS